MMCCLIVIVQEIVAKQCIVTVLYIQACDEATSSYFRYNCTLCTLTNTHTHTQIIINLRYEVKLHSSVVDEEYVSSFEEPHLCKCSKVHSSSTSNCDIIIRGGTVKQLQLSAE